MQKSYILELLQEDIRDLNGLIGYAKYNINHDILKDQTKAILLNLQEHLTELINAD